MDIDVSGDHYLHAEVDGRQAAKVLGVSAGRWRQLTGSRQSPAEIGPGRVRAGVRGARWPLRQVFEYAMKRGREVRVPLPPLLPLESGVPRYEPASGRVWNAPDGVHLVRDKVSAWAQMLVPVSYELCGHPQHPVVLLTPTWPTGSFEIRASVLSLAAQALAQPGWADVLHREDPELAIVVLPTAQNDSSDRLVRSTRVVTIAGDLLGEILPSVGGGTQGAPSRTGSGLVEYEVPVADVARSLGMTALPWWPAGCATSATCARWSPGRPVTVTTPASLRDRRQAALWLSQRGEERADEEQKADYQEIAHQIDPTPGAGLSSAWERDPVAPDGFELAVQLAWPSPIRRRGSAGDWFRALDELLEDGEVPLPIARTALEHFGDPRYARPAHLALDSFPEIWQPQVREYFRGLGTDEGVEVLSQHRWRILDTYHREHSSAGGRPVRVGPLKVPAILGEDHLTWFPPTGYQRGVDDNPAKAIPAAPVEAWFAAVDDRQVRGWVRTLDYQFAPLPAKSQFNCGPSGDTDVLRALVHHTSYLELIQTVGMTAVDNELLRLLTATLSGSSQDTVPWEELIAMAKSAQGIRLIPMAEDGQRR